jgi:HlyD family secretion protein
MKKMLASLGSVLMLALVAARPTAVPAAEPAKTATATRETVTDWYEAVGTVRPRTETRIEAQITAQVVSIKVRPGETVEKGDVLIVLDDRQAVSRLDQARQGLKQAKAAREEARQSISAAEAALKQADAEFRRKAAFFESQAATSQQLEKAQANYLQARANLSRTQEASTGAEARIRQAEEVVKEAEISVGYTRITAPETAQVLARLVEPGDLALPGKPLLSLQTAGLLRLEAHVREGVIGKVALQDRVSVHIATLDKALDATVEEIVPYADPKTRTFLVKAALPPAAGLYPGMFGRLLIPVATHETVVIPPAAILRIGQLEMVQVQRRDRWQRQYITTGRQIGDTVEVLSGLTGGERIGWGN